MGQGRVGTGVCTWRYGTPPRKGSGLHPALDLTSLPHVCSPSLSANRVAFRNTASTESRRPIPPAAAAAAAQARFITRIRLTFWGSDATP